MTARGYTIGQLARAARVHVETIRYYQRRQLLATPARAARGIRRYDAEALRRLVFIRRAQELGFSLREIAELLTLGSGSCAQTRAAAERKRADIDTRLRDLLAMRHTLVNLIRTCGTGAQPQCPILESLSQPAPPLARQRDRTRARPRARG
jgi:MerR family mercuric resistance operon transcriptional regulator